MKLFDYIKGNRRGKEAHRLEKEAMGDPFLFEALEGFDSVEGDHTQAIEKLRLEVIHRSVSRPSRKKWWIMAGAAAGLLLLLTVGGEFLLREQPEQIVPYLAEITDTAPEKEPQPLISLDSSPVEIAQITELQAPVKTGDQQTTIARPAQDLSPSPETIRAKESSPQQVSSEETADLTEFSSTGSASRTSITAKQSLHASPLQALQSETTRSYARFVSGQVVDPEGVPITGATVTVPGTTIAVSTDAQGNFRLPEPETNLLDIAFIGYQPAKVPTGSLPGRIVLKRDSSRLDEIAVIGYGTRKTRTFTGAVTSAATSPPAESALPYGEPVAGMERFREYIEEHKTAIADSSGNPVTGTVLVEFRVNRRGRPAGIRIKQGISPESDTEAIRLLRDGPDWLPAKGRVYIKIEF